MKAVVIFSGGLDSTVLAYKLKNDGYDIHLVSFNYGQRHVKELNYSLITSKKLNASHNIIDLSDLKLKGSSLTQPDIEVPDGHYAASSMAITVVPNRNAIMLSIAYGIAVSKNINIVSTGFHGGDHFVYPDCRLDFVKSFEGSMRLASDNQDLSLYTPFINLSKNDIVEIGHKLNVPFKDTWSCYKGKDYHCGKCGTCNERIEAFELAGVSDPTEYNTSGEN